MLSRQTILLRLMLGVLLALTVSELASAQGLPERPEGPVYDGADMIDAATEAQLDEQLRAYNRETGRAVIVATVPTLDGSEVGDYAQQLAESWDIGGEETEEGVLLLISQGDRKLSVRTARGVQARLTDATAGRIIRNTITPAFKQGDFSDGIAAGVAQIIETLDMDPATARAIEEAEAAARAQEGEGSAAGTFIGAAVWIFMIIGFAFVFGRGKMGRRRRRYGAGDAVGDVILWTAINTAINAASDGDGWGGGGGGFGGGGGGGFGGFGGGGGGFNGGGASGGW